MLLSLDSSIGRGSIPTAVAFFHFWVIVPSVTDEEDCVELHLRKQTTKPLNHKNSERNHESLLANAIGLHDPNSDDFCLASARSQRRRDPSRIPRSDARMPLAHGAQPPAGSL